MRLCIRLSLRAHACAPVVPSTYQNYDVKRRWALEPTLSACRVKPIRSHRTCLFRCVGGKRRSRRSTCLMIAVVHTVSACTINTPAGTGFPGAHWSIGLSRCDLAVCSGDLDNLTAAIRRELGGVKVGAGQEPVSRIQGAVNLRH